MNTSEPDTIHQRQQVRLVTVTSISLILAMAALILTWIISGDLEMITVLAFGILALILVGITLLARRQHSTLAIGSLIVLLLLLVSADVAAYQLDSVSVAFYTVPIVLAATGLGMRAGLATAGVSALVIWLLAWAEVIGLLPISQPLDISHLTFSAPALTVIFLLVALISGLGRSQEN